jgi:hypothetical protein
MMNLKLADLFRLRTSSPLQRIRALLVIRLVVGLALFVGALILFWIVSGTLESLDTILAGFVFVAILLGLARTAQVGHEILAAWLLSALLSLIIWLDVAEYGLDSLGASAYALPIIFTSLVLGFWPGLVFAFVGAGMVWLLAFASSSGWLMADLYQESFLSFYAPALTLYYFLLAFLVGGWNRSVMKLLAPVEKTL